MSYLFFSSCSSKIEKVPRGIQVGKSSRVRNRNTGTSNVNVFSDTKISEILFGFYSFADPFTKTYASC